MSLERDIENQIIKVMEKELTPFEQGMEDCIYGFPCTSDDPEYVRGYSFQYTLEEQVTGVTRYGS